MERFMKPGDLLKNLLQQKKAAAGELESKDSQNAGKSTQKGHTNARGGKVARVGRGAARGS
jgi:hypothetical protein